MKLYKVNYFNSTVHRFQISVTNNLGQEHCVSLLSLIMDAKMAVKFSRKTNCQKCKGLFTFLFQIFTVQFPLNYQK